ncbi:ankyrin repeat domain-containing protein [Pseudomonas entomophila]|uniref:ankyrin repeat domain-containing protein n=1 Tax=Pseudomonas entomophila TaxID=312306 RepID=UPI0024057A4A|nr:ankyrin repeat domain-containing protein [Pseudomonas entomophila]MDF9618452.1 ankyrin repeat domain-containing protein [Pseudomonas entomophila]
MIDWQQLYEKHKTELGQLYDDVREGRLERLRNFAQKYPDLLALPRYGEVVEQSLLHMAAWAGQTEVCQLLLELGLDPNRAYTRAGYGTALELAAGEGHLATCVCLLDGGASVDGLPRSVCTPLYAAAQFGHEHVVALLLERGAEINRLHLQFNASVLDVARGWNQQAVVMLLEAKGARSTLEVDAPDVEGAGQSIVTFVHNTAGWVLPAVFSPPCEVPETSLHISLLNSKTDYKLLFTVGLYNKVPMTELFICLPGNWPLSRREWLAQGPWRFPVQMLERLGLQTLEHEPLQEGNLLLRSDPAYADLPWPESVDALLVIDKPWNKDSSPENIAEDDRVNLFILAPVKFTAKGEPGGKALVALVERKRAASWKVLALDAGC